MPAGESLQGQVKYGAEAFEGMAGLRQFRQVHRPAKELGRRE